MFRGVVLVSLALAIGGARAQSPEEWLASMAEAVEYRNYMGTFLYMTPGSAETFQVFHRNANGNVVERIVALDGAGAEIIRNSRELICIFPRQRSVVVESRTATAAKGNPLKANLPSISGDLGAYYQLEVAGRDRIAGRKAEVVEVSPRDGFRYGYRLWVDHESRMPLKSQLIGDNSVMPLEEIRFTAIRLPDQVPTSAVQTALDTSGFTWVRQSERRRASRSDDMPPRLRRWVATELPEGFMLTRDTVEYTDMSNAPRVHHVYSDGLATVSVFIDAAVAASEQAEGLSMMGAANAYSLLKEGMLVTAMGEVPPRTVEKFAVAMEPAGDE